MKMPDKDPGWMGALLAFYSAYSTAINGFLIAFIVAFRRVVWGGGKLREGIGEGSYVGWSVSISVRSFPCVDPHD